MIEAKGLCKYYGPLTAIEDVTFEIGNGEVVGFLGPNGAGKTTTMKILTGAIPPSRGTAKIAGHYVEDEPLAVKKSVGYLPESIPLYPEMTVESLLRYVAEVKDVPRPKRRSEVARVIERCGLRQMERRITGNLSKGYRQRVGLAQALIGSPPVLILDEPTEGLDPRQIVEIRSMISELAAEHTVLLSTHILPEAALICRRVLIINEGRLVAREDAVAFGDGVLEFEVEADGLTNDLIEKIRAAAGVQAATRLSSSRCAVQSRAGADPRDTIASLVVESGGCLRRLAEKRRSLEDVFIEAVSSESAGSGAQGGIE